MAVTRRFVMLAIVFAVSVGAATWATLRYLVRPPAGAGTPGAAQTPGPGDGRRIKATLYYIAADGQRLEAAEREVVYGEGVSDQASRILEALGQAPPQGLSAPLPPGTALRAVYVADGGAAYADFTGALRANHPGGSLNELLTVYAIVSSLTVNLPAITSVQILIDGHEVDTLAGHVDLRRPLPRAQPWLQKGPA
jgi:hypothetical protein